jgi:hypothetical protein
MTDSRRTLRWLALGAIALLVIAAAAAMLALCAPSASERSAPPLKVAALPLKIITDAPGLTAITAEDLRKAGFDPSGIANTRWQLRKGELAVPLLPLGEAKNLRLVFYAEASDNLYSQEQVYWLDAVPEQGLRPAVRPVGLPESTPQAVVTGAELMEWRQNYNSRLPMDLLADPSSDAAQSASLDTSPAADKWLGEVLLGGRQLTLPLTAPNPAAGPARIELRLWANTSSPEADPDHRVQLALNGQLLAEGAHEGQGFWSIHADVPEGLLKPGDNELGLRAPGDTGARVEQNYPDWLQLTYPQALTAQASALAFAAAPGSFALDGFESGSEVLLWDVSDPEKPVQLLRDQQPLRATAEGVSFADHVAGALLRHYVAAAPSGLRRATIGAPHQDDLRALAGGDYVVIGPAHLVAATQPLRAWRQENGLTPVAVDVEAVYEQFAAGRRGPDAIRSFLRFARAQWATPPRFVLLVGDASYDPRGYAGPAGRTADLTPTCLVDTYFVGETASDHCYADLDDDLAPELAVGRLPAQTPQEIAALTDKIIAYEQTPSDDPWLRHALLIADSDPEFPAASRRIADEVLTLAGYQVDALHLDESALTDPEAARSRLFAVLNSGVGLVNYVGHGSPRWWAGQLLSSEDAARLRNSDRLPIVTALTCLTGFFHHPTTQSLAEAFLWGEGGAIAAFMPSSEGVTHEQIPVAISFYEHLVNGHHTTLGEAIQATKRDLAQTNGNADMIRTFNLLGDPALRPPFLQSPQPDSAEQRPQN